MMALEKYVVDLIGIILKLKSTQEILFSYLIFNTAAKDHGIKGQINKLKLTFLSYTPEKI